MKIFSALSLLIASLLLSVMGWSSEGHNPPPCTEDWHCTDNPSLTGETDGDDKPCKGVSTTWTIDPQVIYGYKMKCDDSDTVGVDNQNWGWVINGPGTPPTGLGTSATWAPDAPGHYVITWTGTGLGQPPCNNEILVNIDFPFDVPFPNGEGKLGTPLPFICRGFDKDINFTIKNKGTCTDTFNWELSCSDPGVTIVTNATGADTLDGGVEMPHTANISVASNATRGFKQVVLKVYSNGQIQTTSIASFEVPKPACTLTPPASVSGCPRDEIYVYWTITNSGHCKETFHYISALGVGDAQLILLTDPAVSGTVDLEPGDSYNGSTGVRIRAGACGTRAINVTVTADEMEPVSEDGNIEVFDPDLVARGDSYDLCPGERKAFGVYIKNEGECDERFIYALAATGDPTILFSGSVSGSVFLQKGAPEYAAPLTRTRADPLTKAGAKIIKVTLNTRCDPEDQQIGVITVPPGSADADLTASASCYPTPIPLTVSVKNTGSCPTTYTWKLKQTGGELRVQLGRTSGTLTIDPGATRTADVNAVFLASSINIGSATFELTVSAHTMEEDIVVSRTVTTSQGQTLTLIGRSWINPQFTDRWTDFPKDFMYPVIIPGEEPAYVTGTHNPQYYAFFALLNEGLQDHGGPAKDGAFRLWSKFVLRGCCSNGKINNLMISSQDKASGSEAGLTPVFGVDNVDLRRINDSTFAFRYRHWGQPAAMAEPLIQAIRPRTTGRIYLWVQGTIVCGSNDVLVPQLNIYGSNFPTHQFYVNGSLDKQALQGPITELWKANPGDPSVVIGPLPPSYP